MKEWLHGRTQRGLKVLHPREPHKAEYKGGKNGGKSSYDQFMLNTTPETRKRKQRKKKKISQICVDAYVSLF